MLLFQDFFFIYFLFNVLDVTEEKFWQILDSMDKLLLKYNIDSTACSQRIICSMVKESAESVASGNGTSADKILDGITW